MKKIILTTLVTCSLVVAANEVQIKQDIVNLESEINELTKNLNQLKTQLPEKIEPKIEPKIEKDIVKDSSFVTHTELGYITTSGNTNTDTFNLDSKVKKNWGPNVFALSLLMHYETTDDVESKNKFVTELEYDYDITDRLSFAYLLGYKKDKFSSFDYQLYTGPGMNYKIIKKQKQNFIVEGNILYSIDSIKDTYKDGGSNVVNYPYPAGSINQNDGDTNAYASYRLKGTYDLQLLENLKFEQILSYRSEFSDTQNYFVYSKSALTSKLSDIFSAGLSYQADYTNKPSVGKASTDKTVTLNLIIDY